MGKRARAPNMAKPVEPPTSPAVPKQTQLQLFCGERHYELRSPDGDVVKTGPATPRPQPCGPFPVVAAKSEEHVPMPQDSLVQCRDVHVFVNTVHPTP
jgi:hypothetical protein